MSDDVFALLTLFNRLGQQPDFLAALAENRRGPKRLLLLLAQEPGLTNAEIAASVSVAPSSVTTLVNQLETMHLVQRKPGQADHRISEIFLTAEGQQIVADCRFVQLIKTRLTKSEQAQLRQLLHQLIGGYHH